MEKKEVNKAEKKVSKGYKVKQNVGFKRRNYMVGNKTYTLIAGEKVSDEVYNLFNELIKLFGKYLKPLKLKRQRRKGIIKRKKDQDLQTDELLIATAYHIAVFRKKRTAIITEDTDFFYLVIDNF